MLLLFCLIIVYKYIIRKMYYTHTHTNIIGHLSAEVLS